MINIGWAFFLFLLGLNTSLIFRLEPPVLFNNAFSESPNDKPTLVRRKFRNEAAAQLPPVSLCYKYDYKNNACVKCMDGFLLVSKSKCGVDPTFSTDSTSSGIQFMRIQNPRQQSQQRSNIILNRNPFCRKVTLDKITCLECYLGFVLDDGQCVQSHDKLSISSQMYLRPVEMPKNTFCKKFNSDGECEACFPDSAFNGTECVIIPRKRLDCRLHQFCLPEISDCLTYSEEGICKSCPAEAVNINGICRVNNLQSLCEKVNEQGKCERCSKYGLLNSNNICSYRDPFCSEFSPNGTCLTCLLTHFKVNGDCLRRLITMFSTIDSHCATWQQGRCIQCDFEYSQVDGKCAKSGLSISSLRASVDNSSGIV